MNLSILHQENQWLSPTINIHKVLVNWHFSMAQSRHRPTVFASFSWLTWEGFYLTARIRCSLKQVGILSSECNCLKCWVVLEGVFDHLYKCEKSYNLSQTTIFFVCFPTEHVPTPVLWCIPTLVIPTPSRHKVYDTKTSTRIQTNAQKRCRKLRWIDFRSE